MAIDKIKRSKGSQYRARVYLPGGQRLSKSFTRKVDADHWEAKVYSDGLKTPELKRHKMRFKELTEIFLNQHAGADLAITTYQKYDSVIRLYILPCIGDIWIDEISKFQMVEFKNYVLKLELSDSMKNFIFSALKTILTKAVEWDFLALNPSVAIKPPKAGMHRTVYWTVNEVMAFLSFVGAEQRLPLYLIALNTGMRVGEIFGLKWDCVDLEARLITVRRTLCQKSHVVKETTKTNKPRFLGITDGLLATLRDLKEKSRGEFAFTPEDAGCRDSSHIARIFAADCKRAGIRTIKFHDLRHTYATQFVAEGGSIHDLSQILGHTTSAMTARYAHFGPEHAKKAAHILSFSVPETGNVFRLKTKNEVGIGHKQVTRQLNLV